jgi:putative flippase GtrA
MTTAEHGVGVPTLPQAGADWLDRLVARLPRPLRFLGVGGLGLITDLGIFTLLATQGFDPLLVRLVSLPCATVVTWRLNRAFTFDRTGRHQGHEAARYAIVTATAQATSYAVFAALVLTVLAWLPQAALLIGAAAGAFVSYNGHRLFAFAPHHPLPSLPRSRGRVRVGVRAAPRTMP